METDPETGEVKPNDKTKGLKPVISAIVFQVTFPNMEKRSYSKRPYFIHRWFDTIKIAANREGGTLTNRDSRDKMLIAHFRTPRAANDFARLLVADHYVPQKEVRSMSKKVAQAPEAVAERAMQHWDAPPIQEWVQEQGLQVDGQDPRFWLTEDVSQNPQLAQSLESAVLEAEQGVRAGEQAAGEQTAAERAMKDEEVKSPKLLFDPTQYVKPGKSAIYLSTKKADVINDQDAVLAETDEGLLEGVAFTNNEGVMPADPINVVFPDSDHLNGKYPVAKLSKISAVAVPMMQFPKQELCTGQLVRYGDVYLRLAAANGHVGHTKVATFSPREVHWLPDDRLTVIVRHAHFTPEKEKEWLIL